MASLTRLVRGLTRSRGLVCRQFLTPRSNQRQLVPGCSCRQLSESSLLWEPDDVNLDPEIPEYPSLNIRMRSYDYVVLESYLRYAVKLGEVLKLDIISWPIPARTTTLQTMKPNSSQLDSEYELAAFERTLQIDSLPSTLTPIIIETLQRHLPQGVWFTVKEPDDEEEEFRYVPDLMMDDLKKQVEEMDQAKEDRRK